ncbi:hypothetical protein Q8A73_007437 [Channa argus]|nr:hypothetical protein Q8A73_007437 [Channa argus]
MCQNACHLAWEAPLPCKLLDPPVRHQVQLPETYVRLHEHMLHESELHVLVIDIYVVEIVMERQRGVREPAGSGRSAQCELLGPAGKHPQGAVQEAAQPDSTRSPSGSADKAGAMERTSGISHQLPHSH